MKEETRETSFCERLARLRKDRDISQPDLAESVGVSPDTYRRWEWGKQEPRRDELLRLAKALGVSFGELATGETASDVIRLQVGEMHLEIPATREGFAFLEGKLKEMTEKSGEQSRGHGGERSAS